MILSASGWRKVFAASGDEQDKNPEITETDRSIAVIAADVFFDYISKTSGQECPVIALGIDTRPTGPAIADAMIHSLIKKGAIIQYSAVTSAPEIMAYSKKLDGFIYISASHNPVGHNGHNNLPTFQLHCHVHQFLYNLYADRIHLVQELHKEFPLEKHD